MRTSPEADIDALFAIPLSEFSAARNALAAQLKKSGRSDEADRVKALAKPSISAWVVNQLYWKHREAFQRLLATGARFRQAQVSQISGNSIDPRKPFDERREALSDLSNRATTLLRNAGHSVSTDMMRRVTATLEALSLLSSLPGAPTAGRLTADVDPPGFEVLAGLIPSSVGAEQGTGKPPALRDAEGALDRARVRAQEADAALKTAVAHATDTEKHQRDAEERLERVRSMSKEAARRVRASAEEADEAAKALKAAERAVEKASKGLTARD